MTVPTPFISVVVPVYNSALTLESLAHRLDAAMSKQGIGYELILVNDCSRDSSWAVIEGLVEQDQRIHGINLMRNYGQHNALLCGIRAAQYPITVTIDDDLQNPPEEIVRLLEHLEATQNDVVYGVPREGQHGLWRNLASRITKIALQGAMGAETARQVSAFRAFRTRLRDAFATYQSTYVTIDVLLTWGTTRFTSCRVQHDPRTQGVSNYSLRKLVIHALTMMTGFSVVPLQVATMVGFLFTLFGIVIFLYVLVIYLSTGRSAVPGFPFLASIIALFSGAQLFALGIIGEYIARIHFRVMDRPPYVVQEATAARGTPHDTP